MFPVCVAPTITLPILEHERLRIFVVEAVLLLVTQAVPRVSGSTNLPIQAILAGDPLHPIS